MHRGGLCFKEFLQSPDSYRGCRLPCAGELRATSRQTYSRGSKSGMAPTGHNRQHVRACWMLVTVSIVLSGVATGVRGAEGLQLADLPRNPFVDCNSSAVTSAFFSCKLSGASVGCCQGLDDVFHTISSPAAGCLCYPQALFEVTQQASRAELDVPSLLKTCSQKHDMQADWAWKQGTTCPDIPLNASVNSLLLQMGDTLILQPQPAQQQQQMGQEPNLWSWRNLLQTAALQARPELEAAIAAGPVLGLRCLMFILVGFVCIAPVYLIMHRLVLLRCSSIYRSLEAGQQMVTCQHAVFFVIFALQLVPQTYLTVRCLFRAWTAAYVSSQELTVLVGGIIVTRAVLYIVESCLRSVVRFSWLLLLHHHLYFVVLIAAIWTLNAPALIIGLVLDWMACHEVLLYLALLAYRLEFPKRLALPILWVGCAWYVLTRVFQTVLLGYMIIGWASHPAVNHTPAYIVTSVLCGAFTVIQAYTLVIYKGIWNKIQTRGKNCAVSTRQSWPAVTVDCKESA